MFPAEHLLVITDGLFEQQQEAFFQEYGKTEFDYGIDWKNANDLARFLNKHFDKRNHLFYSIVKLLSAAV